MDPVKTTIDAAKSAVSISFIVKLAVGFVLFNAILELTGFRDWFYAPISAWRNRNNG